MRKNLFITALATALFSSCVKDEFDQPPAGGADPVVSGTYITIDALKALFTGSNLHITSDIYIAGIVNADDQSGNFYKELVLQDSTGGISVLLDHSDFHTTYKIGRRVFVKCNGLYLGDYNGLLQLGGYEDTDGSLGRIPSALIVDYVLPGSYFHEIIPLPLKPSQLTAANYESYVNRLIIIDSAEFSTVNTTYANAVLQQDVNLTLNTCNYGTVILRSSGFANFASATVPSGSGTLTAVMQIYDSDGSWALTDMQMKIRTTSDVSMNNLRCGSAPPGGFTSLNQDFSSVTDNVDIALGGWLNLAVQGNRYWRGNSFSGNSFAQATAFGSGLPAMETWLITPELNLSSADTLTFESAQGFWVHDGLSAWISTDFDGTPAGFSSATWTQLPAILAGSSTGQYTFISSGNVLLTSFTGSGYIAFKYTGDGTANTTTYRIDNVAVH